ncbi:MAG: T9SS type A sorting domain-containing protein [Bacteroidia bacterium]
MKKLYTLTFLFFAFLFSSAQHASFCQLNLSGYNALPIYLSTPSHDVLWISTYGFNSGQYNSKTYARTTDAGATWQISAVPELNDRGCQCVFALSADVAWIGMTDVNNGGSNSIWKTVDGGQNWQQQLTTQYTNSGSYISSIAFFNATNGVAIGQTSYGHFEIYTTSNGGTDWDSVPHANIPVTNGNEYNYSNGYAQSGDSVWFSTSTGRIFFSYDQGHTWGVTATGNSNVATVTMNDGRNGAAGGYSYDIEYTTTGGLTWQNRTSSIHVYTLGAIPGIPGSFVFRSDLGLYITSDFFQTNVLIDDQIPYNTDPIAMYDPTIGWTPAGSNYPDSMMMKIENVFSKIETPQLNRSELSVFPNPVITNAAMVSFSSAEKSKAILSLYDLSGKKVREMTAEANAGKTRLVFDFTGLSRSMYLLQLNLNGVISQSKVILK